MHFLKANLKKVKKVASDLKSAEPPSMTAA